MSDGKGIIELRDYMPSRKRAVVERDPKSRGLGRAETTPTRIETRTLRKLKALALQQHTDISGAVEWLLDQLPETKASIERFMVGK